MFRAKLAASRADHPGPAPGRRRPGRHPQEMTMRSVRRCAAISLAATAALTLAACGGGGSASSTGNAHVTLTWWNNATAGTLKNVWQQAATAFHQAHPNVTIQVEPIQNEA